MFKNQFAPATNKGAAIAEMQQLLASRGIVPTAPDSAAKGTVINPRFPLHKLVSRYFEKPPYTGSRVEGSTVFHIENGLIVGVEDNL